MYKNKELLVKEREIKLSDLIWKVLYGWRLIVIYAVFFAIFIGGYGIWKNRKDSQAVNNSQAVHIENLLSTMTEEEVQQLKQIETLDKSIRDRQLYLDNSILMNIDPYNKQTISLVYYIDTEINSDMNVDENIMLDLSEDLCVAYESYIISGGYLDKLVECIDWQLEENYLQELITVDEDLNNSDVLMVNISGLDSEQLQLVCNEFEIAISEYKEMLDENIGNHTLVLLNKDEKIISDVDLATVQYSEYLNLKVLRNDRDLLLNKFTSTQNHIYILKNQQIDSQINIDNYAGNEQNIVLFDVKYVLLGIILGVLCACGWIICRYIFGAYIQSAEEIEELYGLTNFGTICICEPHKKILMCVDNIFDKLRKKEKLSREQQLALCTTDLIIKCKKNNITTLGIVAPEKMSEEEKKVIDYLCEKLDDSEISCILFDNMIDTLETFEDIKNIQNTILIEKLGKGTYNGIENKSKTCTKLDINVIGFVMLYE